jgi:hypothetical protein
VGCEETKQPRALGQAREQWPIVARQPGFPGENVKFCTVGSPLCAQ